MSVILNYNLTLISYKIIVHSSLLNQSMSFDTSFEKTKIKIRITNNNKTIMFLSLQHGLILITTKSE